MLVVGWMCCAGLWSLEAATPIEAVKALAASRDARAVPALGEALRDSNKNVRFYAAYALGEIKDAKSANALLDALHDPDWNVRDQAAWALRELHNPKLAAPLAAMLKEKDADVAHIMWLLREIGGEEAFAVFVASLKSENAIVRRAAAEALVKIGGERVEQPLTELMAREKDPAVRAVAEKAVAKMTQSDTLAAHWSFDDKSTTVAKDVSGRATDGEIKGCTVAEGKVGAALRFGKGKFIELGRTQKPSVANTPFTIMAWVKTDAPTGVVVARGGAFCGFSLYLKDGLPKFGIRRSKDGPANIVTGREKLGNGWTHLAGVVRDDCIELHVNGKLAATAKTGGVMPSNGGQGMEIGFDAGNSAIELCDAFEGVIDEVKQFNAALTEKEIAKQCR
jgi:hypothetical protein